LTAYFFEKILKNQSKTVDNQAKTMYN